MEEDPKTEPIRRWNRLARENTENAIVSSMFEASTKSGEPLERFSTWLLVGTALIASFMIVNASNILPLISISGFRVAGTFLCFSCIAGLISKIFALRVKIAVDVQVALKETFIQHLNEYEEEEEKIREGAEFWGITLETGIRMERVLDEFLKPLPKIVGWYIMRNLRKHEGNPQIGHLPIIGFLNRQGLFAIIQAVLFLCFLATGFIFASAI